jgi:long-chain acyl-CoA synthetase
VAFGDQRSMVTAFLNIDMEAVGNWAERHNLPYAGYTDLAAKTEVLTLLREAVSKVNADLASDPALANAQIHRFIVLHKELDADDDELTRTRKVRRGFIQQKFDQLVAAMYSGLNEQYIETAVKFEDGRVGKISATLKVIDAEVFPALKKAA